MATKSAAITLAALLIEGAEVIEYEGRKVINVEGTYLDALDAAPIMSEYLSTEGLFAEPINLALVGVYDI